ncbi:MAG: mechanosensitive ion channel domain-containing protein [bacterium]
MNEAGQTQVAEMLKLFQFERLILMIGGIVLLVLVTRAIRKVTEGLYRKSPSRRLLVSQAVAASSFFIYIFGVTFLVYAVIRPPREVVLAVLGSAAVAIGLSLKDLVASVVAGLILLFDRPFQVGDRVQFESVYGEIKSIGLRAVRLVTLDDSTVTIPNSRFLTEAVSSANSGALDMMVVMSFHVAIDADVRLARDLLYETLVTSRYVYLKKPVTITVTEVAVAQRLALQLKARAYVLDVRFELPFINDVFLRATEAFEQHGIKRPLLLEFEKLQGLPGAFEPRGSRIPEGLPLADSGDPARTQQTSTRASVT